MKKVYLVLFALCCTFTALGQKVEYSVQLTTGLTQYRGDIDGWGHMLSYREQSENSFTFYPHDEQFTLSYGAAGQVQRIAQNRLLYGLQIGAESLRSKKNIYTVLLIDNPQLSSGVALAAEGKAILSSYNLNMQPYVGYRLLVGETEVDLTLGSDIGYQVYLHERGKATAEDGSVHRTSLKRNESDVKMDIRPRLGMAVYKNSFGLSFSYAHGLIDYKPNWAGIDPTIRMRIFRLGLLYRL